MGIKSDPPLLNAVTGQIDPGTGNNQFEITDPGAGKCLKIEGLGSKDVLSVVRHNYAGNGWVPATSDKSEYNDRPITLHNGNTSIALAHVGVYSTKGNVSGTVTLYTEE